MRTKKLSTVLLTAALAVSTLGIGSLSVSAAQDTSGDPTNIYGGLVALDDADDPITFNIFVRDPGQAPAEDNPVLKKITELTGVTIKFEYLVGDLDQKLGVMIAGEDYPDAIFAGDSSTKLMDAGAFIPLEDLIPQYQNLNADYGQVMKYLAQDDGHVYGLEMYGTFINDIVDAPPTFECGLGFYIQKAVLAEAGYPNITTVDQYFDCIESYLEKHPEIDGVATTGFEILADGWRNWALLNPVQNLLGAGNDGAIFVDPETYETSFFQISDTAYAFYKKLNEEYHKGVIDPETFTMNYDQYIAKLTTGTVLGMYDQSWNFSSAQNLLKADGKDDRTYVSVPVTNPGVVDGYIDKNNGIPSGVNGIGITTNCKNPERLLKFYDWLLQRDVQDYLQWGEEGVDFVYSEDGKGKALTEERRAIVNDSARNRDETGNTLWNYSPMWQGIYKYDGMPCGPGDSADEYLASQTAYDESFLEGYGIKYPAEMFAEPRVKAAYYPVWAMSLEDGSAAAVASTKITDVTTKMFSKMIIADEADYDSVWNEFLDEFNSINLDAYQAEIDRQIEVKMSK